MTLPMLAAACGGDKVGSPDPGPDARGSDSASGGSGGVFGFGGRGGRTGSGGVQGTGGSGGASMDAAAVPDAATDAAVDTRPVLPMAAVPAPWIGENIGPVGMPGGSGREGQAASRPGRFHVQGSGADIFGAADEFQFLHRSVTGDFEFVARLASLERADENTKAGLMVRETLAADARNAFMLVFPQATGNGGMSKGTRLQFRDKRVDLDTSYQDLVSLRTDAPDGTPIWLRLVRRGQEFFGSISADGVSFIDDGSVRFDQGAGVRPMPAQVELGLAVTSHDNDDTAMAVFERVRITSITDPAWSHNEIGTLGGVVAGSPARFTIQAANRGVQNSRDGLTFVHRNQQVIGDVEITARISALTAASNDNLRAGVMLRNGLDQGDRMVAFATSLTAASGQRPVLIRRPIDDANVTSQFPMVVPPVAPDGGVADATPDASTTDAAVDAGPKPRPPFAATWLKLVRVGNRFAGFTSTNGIQFTYAFEIPAGTVLSGNAFAGVFLTSQSEQTPAEGVIESVTIRQPPITPLPALPVPDAGAPDTSPAGDGGPDAPAAMP